MPISEDEFEPSSAPNTSNGGLSKAEQRRSNKPIMEKRRRARINHCLNELKTLILEAMKKDPARHSKLEKADILAMTVKHLQNVQRQQLAVAVATDPTVLQKFKSGFSECANEVSRYINRIEGVDTGVRQRLQSHLTQCVAGLNQLTPLAFGAITNPGGMNTGFPISNAYQGNINNNGFPTVMPQVPFPTGDVNNNHSRLMNGLQLIPSRLPTGELALLVPGSSQMNASNIMPYFPAPPASTALTTPPVVPTTAAASVPGNISDRSHPSAFTAVHRSQTPTSPTSSSESIGNVSSTNSSYPSPSSPDIRYPIKVSAFQFPDVPAKSAKCWRRVEPMKRPGDMTKPTCTVRGSPSFLNNNNSDSSPDFKDPIDFSIKRTMADNVWMTSSKRLLSEESEDDYEHDRKEAKLSYRDSCDKPQARFVKVEPLRPQNHVRYDNYAEPSTSSDMWRPW